MRMARHRVQWKKKARYAATGGGANDLRSRAYAASALAAAKRRHT
jgi:hypothetical protein